MAPQGVSAEVKQVLYHWWDLGEPATGATHFGATVQVLIGSTDRDHADSFDGIVCSRSDSTSLSGALGSRKACCQAERYCRSMGWGS